MDSGSMGREMERRRRSKVEGEKKLPGTAPLEGGTELTQKQGPDPASATNGRADGARLVSSSEPIGWNGRDGRPCRSVFEQNDVAFGLTDCPA